MATNDDEYYQKIMDELGTSFELSASGKLTWFLGCKVKQDLVPGTMRMSRLQCVLVRTRLCIFAAHDGHDGIQADCSHGNCARQ